MFQAGTKVYVCGSSVTGKKLGPKRHSLGYVSNTQMASVINPVKNFPVKDQRFILFPLKVIFTRYGKEKKLRSEHRDFLHIMPLYFDACHEVNVGKIQEVIRILKSGELSKNPMWYDIGCNYSQDPSNIGTLLPVYSKSVAQLKGNEAKAWVYSIIRNDIFRHLIMKNKYLPTLITMADSDIVNWVSNSMKGSGPRRDLIRWADDDPQNMRRLVIVVRALSTAFGKRIQENQRTLSSVSLESNSYFTWLMDNLFSDIDGFENKIKVAKKLGISSSLEQATKNTKLVRDTYLTLKPSYI